MHRERGQPCLRALQGFSETLPAERLDEIVHGVCLERLDGIVLKRGHENGGGHPCRTDRRHDIHALDAGHLDIEENKVRRLVADSLHGGNTVAAFAQYLDLRIVAQQAHDGAASERLVIDDKHGDRHAVTISGASSISSISRNGSWIRQTTPSGQIMSRRTWAASP